MGGMGGGKSKKKGKKGGGDKAVPKAEYLYPADEGAPSSSSFTPRTASSGSGRKPVTAAANGSAASAGGAAIDMSKSPDEQWQQAAKVGALAHMKKLHAEDASLLEKKARGIGHTALHWAAANEQCEVVQWLLEVGMSPNIRNNGDSTPLHSAAGAGATKVVKQLLERGADKTLGDSGDETAAQLAAARGHAEVVALLA